MRTISTAGLAMLRTPLGTSPICIVEIDWTDGTTSTYADSTVGTIPGKIVEMSALDDATSLAGNSSSSQLSVTLDDTDGSIKAIFDTHDPHKRPARVYQYFTGLGLSDRFLLFSGVLMSPISWSERERTVKVTIVSQLEDQECGFTTDESISGPVPDTIPNEAWPMIFGTVAENKAVRLRPAVHGTILAPVGVLAGEELMLNSPDDPGVEFCLSIQKSCSQMDFVSQLISSFSTARDQALDSFTLQDDETPITTEESLLAQYPQMSATQVGQMFFNAWKSYSTTVDSYTSQLNSLNVQIRVKVIEWEALRQCTLNQRQVKIDQARLQGYGTNPVPILGGETFPQGPVIANINGCIFNGTMAGNMLTIGSRQSEYLEELAQGMFNNITNGLEPDPAPVTVVEPTMGTGAIMASTGAPGMTPGMTPSVTGTIIGPSVVKTFFCKNHESASQTWNWSAKVPVGFDGQTWQTSTTPPTTCTVTTNEDVHNYDTILQHLWIPAGAGVQITSAAPPQYIASITPGTITAVQAMCDIGGVQLLRDVPSYTLQNIPAGSATAIQITVPELLSSIQAEHWGDDIYVSFTSSIGPKVTDILQYIVEHYSDLTCDPVSFAACQTPYPANFALNSSRNVINVLQDIAFQACCRLWIENRVVYIAYLPQRPAAVDTITLSDIEADGSVEVELTATEDLVTKMQVKWSELPVPQLETTNERVWNGTTYINQLVSGNDPGDIQHQGYTTLLRNNIAKYGYHDATYNWYIYNTADAVEACAKFWLSRKSNTWKRVRFTTPLHKLNLETFDAVTLNFSQPFVASGPVLALVESAKYDSAKNCINFECITPVLAGTAKDCGFFWSS